MEQMEIFSGNELEIKKQINNWLAENKDKIKKITGRLQAIITVPGRNDFTPAAYQIFISIFYVKR
jgi:hypothetical protein